MSKEKDSSLRRSGTARHAVAEVNTIQSFGGPEQVLEYLGRYTHRVAITNNRILSIEGSGEVTFNYRDRSDENKVKALTLKATEFIRRYLLHILPRGFMKIRYYGFLSHANKKVSIPLLRLLIDPEAKIAVKSAETVQEMMMRLTGVDLSLCPDCCSVDDVKLYENSYFISHRRGTPISG